MLLFSSPHLNPSNHLNPPHLIGPCPAVVCSVCLQVHQLGLYGTEEAAAEGWDRAAVMFRGHSSQLNFPARMHIYLAQVQVRRHVLRRGRCVTWDTKKRAQPSSEPHRQAQNVKWRCCPRRGLKL